jgi:hypothetical protein
MGDEPVISQTIQTGDHKTITCLMEANEWFRNHSKLVV